MVNRLSSRRATMMARAQPPPGVLMAIAHASCVLVIALHASAAASSAHVAEAGVTRAPSRRGMLCDGQSAQLTPSDDKGACTAASGRADGHSTRFARACPRLTRLGCHGLWSLDGEGASPRATADRESPRNAHPAERAPNDNHETRRRPFECIDGHALRLAHARLHLPHLG